VKYLLDTNITLAATARVHGMTLVTRNVAHVSNLGAQILNPFEPNRAE
jgi:predicted nucleic acid-binding protein